MNDNFLGHLPSINYSDDAGRILLPLDFAADFRSITWLSRHLDKRGHCAYVPTASGTAALLSALSATSSNATPFSN
jgi:hypothetical protein